MLILLYCDQFRSHIPICVVHYDYKHDYDYPAAPKESHKPKHIFRYVSMKITCGYQSKLTSYVGGFFLIESQTSVLALLSTIRSPWRRHSTFICSVALCYFSRIIWAQVGRLLLSINTNYPLQLHWQTVGHNIIYMGSNLIQRNKKRWKALLNRCYGVFGKLETITPSKHKRLSVQNHGRNNILSYLWISIRQNF